MTLIASVAGIRGTIGGQVGENLTPLDVCLFSMAFFTLISQKTDASPLTIVIGRDARVSGENIQEIVVNTLLLMGANVVDLGLTTTPTVEMAVIQEKAHAGIILTASHNPVHWNALKLLNEKGEFISAEFGQKLIHILQAKTFALAANYDRLGKRIYKNYLLPHLAAILALPNVQTAKIIDRKFKIVVDGINSVGSLYVPALLEKLGAEVFIIHGEPNGIFEHNPEPLPENLRTLAEAVVFYKADLGVSVDPDVDRLVLVNEDGTFFGEEYTLVTVADYVLKHKVKNEKKYTVVSNLSSSKALQDIAEKHGALYYASAVGEVHVVKKMKEVQAVIGGEGNGGVIDPNLHYGRDALVGIALILSHLSELGGTLSQLRATYPSYYMAKEKMMVSADFENIKEKLSTLFSDAILNNEDGLKITFPQGDWVHVRASNTEPIIRIYTESTSQEKANNLAKKIIQALTH